MASREPGWEVVGIHAGYDGLRAPEAYPEGGIFTFDARAIDSLDAAGSILGTAARDAQCLAIVEVPGNETGWLAPRAGLAARADVNLIPEAPYGLRAIATSLGEREQASRRPAPVVAVEGARTKATSASTDRALIDAIRKSLSPLADPSLGDGARVIDGAGGLAEEIALSLQRMTGLRTLPIPFGHLVRGGARAAIARQLGLGHGAVGVQALREGPSGVMLAFQPPDLKIVPLGEAVNQIRTVPANSEFQHVVDYESCGIIASVSRSL